MDLSLLQRRIFKDKAARWVMLVLTVLSLLLLIAIGIGLFFKSRLILSEHSLWELLSGSAWKPLSGEFGFLPFIVGTLFVTALSIAIALPISLLSAIFLTEYASSWVKRIVFPIFDILAGIPSVVYGVWGTLIIVPWIADKLGPRFVDYTSGYTVLASGIVLGIMILPILVSLLIDIFTIVPGSLSFTGSNQMADLLKGYPAKSHAGNRRCRCTVHIESFRRNHSRIDGMRKLRRHTTVAFRPLLPASRTYRQQLR